MAIRLPTASRSRAIRVPPAVEASVENLETLIHVVGELLDQQRVGQGRDDVVVIIVVILASLLGMRMWVRGMETSVSSEA